ncbi:MAG: ribosome maturation factor RimM [Candidatus Methylumidiphilus sp.]
MADLVVVGEVAGAFGVKGWVKIHSHTIPEKNILSYSPWLLSGKGSPQEFKVLSGRIHGTGIVAQLDGIDDRDQAIALRSCQILVSRDRFPSAKDGEYYWADLIGLKVQNLAGVDFGTVTDMMETGANDVVVATGERERLIPFVFGQYIKDISLSENRMLVDWDADF